MPTYDYKCDRCGRKSEDARPVADRAKPEGCPRCERGYLQLVPSLGPGVFPGADQHHRRTAPREQP